MHLDERIMQFLSIVNNMFAKANKYVDFCVYLFKNRLLSQIIHICEVGRCYIASIQSFISLSESQGIWAAGKDLHIVNRA